MPSTVSTTRPDQATGFRHISEPANALVSAANSTQPANAVAMHDAVDRWIAEAKAMAPEASLNHLIIARARIDACIQNLADYACDRAPLWRHLEGLTVDHLEAAAHRLDKALSQTRRQIAPAHPWMTAEERAKTEAA